MIDACKYCSFKSICKFDENTNGFEARQFEKAENYSEILDLMKKELGEEESVTD